MDFENWRLRFEIGEIFRESVDGQIFNSFTFHIPRSIFQVVWRKLKVD